MEAGRWFEEANSLVRRRDDGGIYNGLSVGTGTVSSGRILGICRERIE